MIKTILVTFVGFCVLFVITTCDRIQQISRPKVYSNSLKTPDEVVKVFCDLDASGKRLSSLTWPEMQPYIIWTEEAMESAAVVISSYKLSVEEKTNQAASIIVEYDVLGKYWPGKLMPVKAVEKVTFTVIKTEVGWKIKCPDTMVPHVLPESLITHLEKIEKKEDDPNVVKEIRNRVQVLERLKKKKS